MTEKGDKTQKKKKVRVFTKNFNKRKQNKGENDVIKSLQEEYEKIDLTKVKTFSDLPLSTKTQKALKKWEYTQPTDIQRETLQLALKGKDVLGAAHTGSGKTLAFLVPLLEILYCRQWTRLDGVGALVITPTRELAYQIFESLRKIGEFHDFSAGLIIGGKDLKFERNRMDQCNIVICTPGRLLQHMDENPLFDCVTMQVLVLDEADRILDMGFAQTMNAIIANLPVKRQTMLFSATQTKSVKDLARLSLKDPSYVAVHENRTHSTPASLEQSYVVCELHEKLSILWSFIKNHSKQKIIVFFATCKQVKYTYEVFTKLRASVGLLPLYGTLHQLRRMKIYEDFMERSSAVLLATDIAARGLDFPEVHWVVQVDCPEDADTYIHRVGRTARYHRGGESLLLLLPSETSMLDELTAKKIPINKIDINKEKLLNPVRKIEAFLAKDENLKDTAQRAFSHYAKAVFLMKNKNVFKLNEIDMDGYANSLGLTIPPKIHFLQKMKSNRTVERRKLEEGATSKKIVFKDSDDEDNSDDKDHSDDKDPDVSPVMDKTSFKLPDDSEDILMTIRKEHSVEEPAEKDLIAPPPSKVKPVTKAALVKKMLNKKVAANKRIVFDEDGEMVGKRETGTVDDEFDLEKFADTFKEEDVFDKQTFREKVKSKHKETKRKLKEQKKREKEEDEEKDEFGTDSEDDEPPVDLSWLPDPDKIYGEKQESDEEVALQTKRKKKRKSKSVDEAQDPEVEPVDKIESSEEIVEARDESSKGKRKRNNSSSGTSKRRNITDGLSVNEAEELALLLLKG